MMRVFVFSLLAALAASGVAHARTVVEARGGPGGAPFIRECGPNEYMTGLRVKSGDRVDAIGPYCARWNAESRTMEGRIVRGGIVGGPGGGEGEAQCPGASAIDYVTVQPAARPTTVGQLIVFCGDARPDAPPRRINVEGRDAFGVYNDSVWPQGVRCPPGEIATGIHGRTGDYVDAIGLICASKPALPPSRVQLETKALGGVAEVGRLGAPSRTQVLTQPSPGLASAPTCRSGFVWREARNGDVVCVPPESRARVRAENASARSRVDPNGAYGPATCLAGFVWREAFDGDVVCVTPEVRQLVREENAMAGARRN